MNIDEFQSVRDRERQTDKLQQLRETFYADAGEFIQELREKRDRAAERADDPFDSPEVSRLSDEIETAEGTVEAIYEKRVGKIVKAASFAAADLPADSDGMTAEERDLFETLVADIKASRQHVLDVLAGEETPATATGGESDRGVAANARSGPAAGANEASDTTVSAADVMGHDDTGGTDASADPPAPPESETGGSETPGREPPTDERMDDHPGEDPSRDGPDVDRETVRITDDVGAIFGVDEREYDLAENDVVQLPAANAEPLVERDAAERLD
jgi:DNA replication factor GINS